ncbi:MAG: HAMP domain-containing sensor histidine kinase [Pseudomonadales bacterium]|nr:HAMP domain-containing sensor histidine kinase [Pseudomonadales bacterium]
MNNPSLHSLKFRLIVALVVIVTVTSTLFATGVLFIKQQLEEVIFGDLVRQQMQTLLADFDSSHYANDFLFERWNFYHDGNTDGLAPEIMQLPLGSHHSVSAGAHFYQVEVASIQGQKVFLTYDITAWENQEHEILRLLLYGVGLVLLAAIVMGISAAKAILAPVRALSQRLATIKPGERKLTIAQDFQGSEIGQIAAAFDQYLERIDNFVERERSFTAAASHELRTPLSVMMGAVDVLGSNPQSEASSRAIDRIKRACRDMLAFIETTLFLSREEASTINQGPPARLSAIIEGLLRDCEAQCRDKHIRIETRFLGEPRLDHPASLLQITLGNILRNAIEHTHEGTITLTVDNHQVCVEDSGEGIHPDSLPRVYERSYSTKPGGTGMGLDLVKRICERFHWLITIESTPGKGTKVLITFAK